MLSLPFVLIFGIAVFLVRHYGDAAISHLLTAGFFGLFLGATPVGPGILHGIAAAGTAVAAAWS